jgi:flavin-dependent dehydrogenase
MTSDWDVIVVGGGLAGLSAAATLAADGGPRVLLVERLGLASNLTTPMTFADVPARYGLERAVTARYRGFVFHSPLGNRSQHDFAAPELVALDYGQAGTLLWERAHAGGVILRRAAALGLQRDRRGWLVRLSDGATVHAPLLLDASGRALFTHRALGLPAPRQFSHCYGLLLENCPAPDPELAYFLAPSARYGSGGGWFYPLDGGRASFGYAELSTDRVFPSRRLQAGFRRALAEFQPYADWARRGRVRRVEVGSIPIFPLRRLAYDGLVIAGDAAGQATIWSCMGSAAALEAGELAAAAVRDAWQAGDPSAARLAAYTRGWDARHRRTYRHNGWIAPVSWSMSDAQWNAQIPRLTGLSGAQMVARLRENWPVPTLAQVAFVRLYDLAGRLRRGLVRRLTGRPAAPLGERP